MGNES